MSWGKLDDGLHSNPKILAAGNAATGVYARALSYANAHRTDGFVPVAWARTAGNKRELQALVDNELWAAIGKGEERTVTVKRYNEREERSFHIEAPADGYLIPDFLEYNLSRDELHTVSLGKAEAGRKGADKRWHGTDHDTSDSSSHGGSNGKSMARGRASRPVPEDVPQGRLLRDEPLDNPPDAPLPDGGGAGNVPGWATSSAKRTKLFDAAERWVRNDGWRLSAPQRTFRLADDYGINDGPTLAHLSAIGDQLQQEAT